MTDHTTDHIADIAARARLIQDLAGRVQEERAALRAALTAADRTRLHGREELVAAARGGLSRALVLAHLRDTSGRVRRALGEHGLEADVAVRRDGTVTVGAVSLHPGQSCTERLTGDDGDDEHYERAQQADRIGLANALGAFLRELHQAGLQVSTDGPDTRADLAAGRAGAITPR